MLEHLRSASTLVFKIYNYIAVILDAAEDALDTLLLVVWDADKVDAPLALSYDTAEDLVRASLEQHEKVNTRHRGGNNLIHVILEHLRDNLVFKEAPRRLQGDLIS